MESKETLTSNEEVDEEEVIERPYTLKNLLGVPLIIMDGDGDLEDPDSWFFLPQDEGLQVACTKVSDTDVSHHAEYVDWYKKNKKIAMYPLDVGRSCINVPKPEADVYYIVSEAIHLAHPDREDLLSPVISAAYFPGSDEPRMFCVGLRGSLPPVQENP